MNGHRDDNIFKWPGQTDSAGFCPIFINLILTTHTSVNFLLSGVSRPHQSTRKNLVDEDAGEESVRPILRKLDESPVIKHARYGRKRGLLLQCGIDGSATALGTRQALQNQFPTILFRLSYSG
jgi:hypothetical protein